MFNKKLVETLAEKRKETLHIALELYNKGEYEEVIALVRNLYGWKSEELHEAESAKELASWCLSQI